VTSEQAGQGCHLSPTAGRAQQTTAGSGWQLTRRGLFAAAAAGAATITISPGAARSLAPSVDRLPRWRGFNLYELCDVTAPGPHQFQEFDFDTIAGWGFDFVRLPCSYRFWASPQPTRWLDINDDVLARTLDPAIAMGRARGIHVNLCLLRIPGYCVASPAEALDLWSDEAALDAAAHHWTHLARRYKGIPSADLSFNLVNEPPDTISVEQYLRVHRRLRDAVREVDPSRLVIVDAMDFATEPALALAGEGMGVSMHAYHPFELSHYQASWIPGADSWPVPTWPLRTTDDPDDGTGLWDRDRLRLAEIVPFARAQERHIGVHVGELGFYQHTPHDVALRWLSDQLELVRAAGWGWALWNLRGGFGVLDSNRTDVKYEAFRGHLLDRQLLELLRAG
jgi:endoglucanase